MQTLLLLLLLLRLLSVYLRTFTCRIKAQHIGCWLLVNVFAQQTFGTL